MHAFRFLFALPLLFPAALTLAACDDATGIGEAVIVTDTVTIGAPSVTADTVPSALDVLAQGLTIGGTRFPERPADADAWDVTLRLRNGELLLLPRGAAGVDSRRAAITDPITGVTFEGVEEAPPSSRFFTDRGVVLGQGNVYVVRSRSYSAGAGTCWQYAKVQPLELDPAAGTARLQVATSSGCADQRLVED